MNTPKEIIELNMNSAVNKANLKLSRMIALGIMAGMFIARWEELPAILLSMALQMWELREP